MVKNISKGNVNNQIRKLSQLKSNQTFALVTGTYKEYVAARKAFAKEAIKDVELTKQAKGGIEGKIPVFSRLGMKILKNMFLDLFRKKTPEEKQLNKLAKFDKFMKSKQAQKN